MIASPCLQHEVNLLAFQKFTKAEALINEEIDEKQEADMAALKELVNKKTLASNPSR